MFPARGRNVILYGTVENDGHVRLLLALSARATAKSNAVLRHINYLRTGK